VFYYDTSVPRLVRLYERFQPVRRHRFLLPGTYRGAVNLEVVVLDRAFLRRWPLRTAPAVLSRLARRYLRPLVGAGRAR